MMDFLINKDELAGICGLPHIQQLAYLRGIRPYMDVKTAIVGVKRRISYQSISEQLYIEPHQGIKCQSFSRDQVRRAVAGLARAGVIVVQSEGMQLILKCKLAHLNFSVQNKAAILPPQFSAIESPYQNTDKSNNLDRAVINSHQALFQKAATPLKDNNYIYLLLPRFEKFWSLYPEKKSKETAFNAFAALNPDDILLEKLLTALTTQITHRTIQMTAGLWVPPWKHPANWLTKRSWEDELIDLPKEKQYGTSIRSVNRPENDRFAFAGWGTESEERTPDNILPFERRYERV